MGSRSRRTADNYWFPDYLADLDFLLDHYSPDAPVHLVGHSMGGNVAMLYSGSRPAPRSPPGQPGGLRHARHPSRPRHPTRYARWIDELKAFHRGEMALKRYDSVAGVASRLMKTNKRLTPGQGRLAGPALGQARCRRACGAILGDPAHKITNPQLYRVDEVLEIYQVDHGAHPGGRSQRRQPEPVVEGQIHLGRVPRTFEVGARCPPVAVVQDAGHMLHHDQPEQLASCSRRSSTR